MSIIHLGIPALAPLIQEELQLTRTEVGFLSTIMNGSVVMVAIAAGRAADFLGERLIIAYGSIASGLIIMGMNWVGSFATLLPVLLLSGLATATSTPAGSKAVAGWFPQNERGTAMSLRQMGIPLGGALAAVILPPLALRIGWRLALAVSGLFTIGMGLLALRLYQEPPASSLHKEKAARLGIRELLRRSDIWAGIIYVFILAGGQWCMLFYLELYLKETLGFPITLAAGMLALGQICGVGGRILWGLVSDRLLFGRRRPVLLLVTFLAILTTLGTSQFSLHTPFWLVFLVVALLGMTLLGWNGVYLALLAERVGTHGAGMAIGLSNTGAFLGIVMLPPVFGFVVDRSHSYRQAWFILAGLVLIAILALRWLKEDRS
ncbi:MAG: MFS transporter [Deltaproteobacteria bacterium]|nr:MFS transporter [Deltaproteobacteria bacterium]